MRFIRPSRMAIALLGAAMLPAALAQQPLPADPAFTPGRFIGFSIGQAVDIDSLDIDGNGYLDFEEFDAPRLESAERMFDMLDRDGNGLIGPDETAGPAPGPGLNMRVVEARNLRRLEGAPPPGVVICQRAVVAAPLPLAGPGPLSGMDANGDGSVDMQELQAAMEESAFALFDRLDADGDGLVSADDMRISYRAPSAPGPFTMATRNGDVMTQAGVAVHCAPGDVEPAVEEAVE